MPSHISTFLISLVHCKFIFIFEATNNVTKAEKYIYNNLGAHSTINSIRFKSKLLMRFRGGRI